MQTPLEDKTGGTAFAPSDCHRCERSRAIGHPAYGLDDCAGRSPDLRIITLLSGLPSFPVTIMDEGSPLTVAGAATVSAPNWVVLTVFPFNPHGSYPNGEPARAEYS